MKVVVVGATGGVGSRVVTKLREHGHEVVPAALETGVNTVTGQGLAEAVTGADVVVDVSNSPSREASAVLDFFTTSTRNLLAAEQEAGVGHHVALSVVGAARTGSGHGRAKVAQEQLIEAGPVPYSIVHATQFFEFAKAIAAGATDGNTVRLPPVLVQPMAVDEVAAVVADVSVRPPLNGIVEVGGPEAFRMDEFIRRALSARHDPREVIADENARYFGARLGERTLLPGDDALVAETRFEDWLAESVGGSSIKR